MGDLPIGRQKIYSSLIISPITRVFTDDDFSINLFTLMALVLAIGIVVDDAIVMLENIVRRIELGDTPLVAAYKGAKQVSFAIIATTVVLVAVFVPLIFIKGITGVLFTQTAITLASAVIISSFVALSLSPMLASKFLQKDMQKSKIVLKFEKFSKTHLQRIFSAKRRAPSNSTRKNTPDTIDHHAEKILSDFDMTAAKLFEGPTSTRPTDLDQPISTTGRPSTKIENFQKCRKSLHFS